MRDRDGVVEVASAVLAVALFLSLPASAVAQPVEPQPAEPQTGTIVDAPAGRPMTRAEIGRLYAGRTWVWRDGAGYFAANGRFRAAVSKTAGAPVARASGTWLTAHGGRMCYAGLWRTGPKAGYDRTCFVHRIDGETIFQKREPSGVWYTFHQTPPLEGEEFGKIVRGDRVSERLAELQANPAP